MGTNNFSSPDNASKYFAVLCNVEEKYVECNECGSEHWEWESEFEEMESNKECSCGSTDIDFDSKTRSPESWEGDEFIENIGDFIQEQGGTSENEYLNCSSSYGEQSLGYFEEVKDYGDVGINVRLTATLTSGYYEGATLDFNIEMDNGGGWSDIGNGRNAEDINEVLDNMFDWNSDMPKGMQKIQVRHAENWVEKTVSELSEKMEKVFEVFTQHKLTKSAQFSDGTAVYQKVA